MIGLPDDLLSKTREVQPFVDYVAETDMRGPKRTIMSSSAIVNISQDIKNVSKGQEYSNNAFMTQYPQGEEIVKEKSTKVIQKTKADKEGE